MGDEWSRWKGRERMSATKVQRMDLEGSASRSEGEAQGSETRREKGRSSPSCSMMPARSRAETSEASKNAEGGEPVNGSNAPSYGRLLSGNKRVDGSRANTRHSSSLSKRVEPLQERAGLTALRSRPDYV